jgi:cytochrome c biogenesis protein CcdA
VLELALLIVSIGLVDSINAGTILPALYLATGTDPARRTLAFAAGMFLVNLLGGIALLAGLRRLFPGGFADLGAHARHLGELALGAAALLAACLLWRARERVGRRFARPSGRAVNGSLLGGAIVGALELPTALPYFAVISAIAGARESAPAELAMLVLFNLVFLAPVLAIAALVRIAGSRTRSGLERLRGHLLAHIGAALAIVLLAVAIGLLLAGSIGLAG